MLNLKSTSIKTILATAAAGVAAVSAGYYYYQK